MKEDKSNFTAAQWAEGVGILIVNGVIIVFPLVLLGALLHVHFLILGAPALA